MHRICGQNSTTTTTIITNPSRPSVLPLIINSFRSLVDRTPTQTCRHIPHAPYYLNLNLLSSSSSSSPSLTHTHYPIVFRSTLLCFTFSLCVSCLQRVCICVCCCCLRAGLVEPNFLAFWRRKQTVAVAVVVSLDR